VVTGGNSKERWWCWAYAWIIAAFIIIYCILIIVISFASLFTYNGAIDKVEVHELNNKMSQENSNQYAKTIIETNNEVEQFAIEYKQAQQGGQPSPQPLSPQRQGQQQEQREQREPKQDETHKHSSCPKCPECPPNRKFEVLGEVPPQNTRSSSHSDLEPFTKI